MPCDAPGAKRANLTDGFISRFASQFPLTLSPDATLTSALDLKTFIDANHAALMQSVAAHGAVLLRGWNGSVPIHAFPVDISESGETFAFDVSARALAFSAAVKALQLSDCDMSCSSAPRKNVAPGVWTANEAPPNEVIPFHHEMAQCPAQPSYICFFCETPPTTGGETPILPSVWAARYLRTTHPASAGALSTHGVKYVRVIPDGDDPSSPLGRSWQSAFGVKTRAEAEGAMAKMGMTWEWLPNGDVRTVSKRMPFFVEHNGSELFFNACVAAVTGWGDTRNEANKTVIFGNGQPLDDATLNALHSCARYMRERQVAFPWQAGDMLILDNKTVMHSRATFTGPRRVLAAVNGPPSNRLPMPPSSTGSIGLETRVPALRLRSWDEMPVVGLGTWKIPKDATSRAVLEAIKQGYRHLDCACDYGNEKQVGEGIAMAIAEGYVRREDLCARACNTSTPLNGTALSVTAFHDCTITAELFVTPASHPSLLPLPVVVSKLWNTYHAPEHVEPACRKSLADLGLNYLDLYLIHFPISLQFVPFEERYPPEWVYDPSCEVPRMELAHVPYHVTWGAMEMLQKAGLCRNIGVANLTCHAMRDLLASATIPPSVLQVELHPYLQQEALLRFCKEHGIVVTGFSPLGSSSYVELDMAKPTDSVLAEPCVQAIARAHKKTAAQVILRWAVQRGTSAIPKSSQPGRTLQNLDLFDFHLSEEEMATIRTLDKHRRFNDPGVFCEGMGGAVPIFD